MHLSSRRQLNYNPTHNRNLSYHKTGVIPQSSKLLSPVLPRQHKYELKQRIWPKQTVESWFSHAAIDDRRAVYSFLNTLYDDEVRNSARQPQQFSKNRFLSHTNSHYPRQNSQTSTSRTSKNDLGEILESLESVHPASSIQDKYVQTNLPEIVNNNSKVQSSSHLRRFATSFDKPIETSIINDNNNDNIDNSKNETKINNRETAPRYLSKTWRVINPRENVESQHAPDENISSFFMPTKKVFPEYFFIHPDWY
ncbi:unnamed protein product [Didymodactylos carnosus]|uniref:Uncharacterized protein n=1 Tax=Didymodactylos carnosus TaxID=1234261 RepID=A0A813P0E0_9BILA|nr:unnamed protein product [Didymodactylos carnosus]CAF0744801.1 unnamed protein product [Didymodactylos carnosus]CAF3519954.1 unnamed protein product [Didymodactylos carnosus]CAF3522701.1 unnamed protein product [Didymodactylos carnosus]